MTKNYEFPEEFRLVTDEPIEDDGWGEFRTEQERASIVILNMAEFITCHHCLLDPTLDVDKHIAALIKKRDCPVGKERTMCPCHEAADELEKDGYSSCGVFVTERYLQLGQYANYLRSCKQKTKALLKRYKELEGGGR